MYLITAFLFIVTYTALYRLFKRDRDADRFLDKDLGTRQLYHHVHAATRNK